MTSGTTNERPGGGASDGPAGPGGAGPVRGPGTASGPAEASTPVETNPQADAAAMPYEAARDELLAIVRRLESGAAELEESLALWERGEALAARCQAVLDGALARLDAARDNGVPSAGPEAVDPNPTRTTSRN